MFSKRANNVSPSVTVELNARVAQMIRDGIDIIKMNIGEPDFNTPDNIKDAAKQAIDNNFTRYTPTPGIPDLIQAIIEKLKKDNNLEYAPNEICVTTGAKQALYEAVLTLVGEGDEVIVPTPCWVSYEDMIKLAGGVPVTVPTIEKGEKRFHLDLERIEKAITSRTTAIMINTPNNPTGVVYTKEELEGLAQLCIRHDIWIISDEVYEKLIYEDAVHVSLASISKEAWNRTVTINGCSKTYAMTGWRLGYAAAPAAFMKKMRGMQGHITSGVNAISQKAAVEAIGGPQESVEKMKNEFDRRRIMMYKKLCDIPGITLVSAEGAFYLLPDVSSYFGKTWGKGVIHDSCDMAEYLLEKAKVAVVPGDGFRAPGCLRLSYSNSYEKLSEGIERIEEALKELK
jgi:aspartate aminotransferase